MASRILLVDDDADTARVFQHLLRIDGHVVARAESIAAALKHLKSQAFQLLITDIELPDGNGLDLLRHARAHGPVKGLVVSGHGEEGYRDEAEKAGFDGYLLKPVDLTAVRETIARVLAEAATPQ
jgi:CheY-like chemotaxis protein